MMKTNKKPHPQWGNTAPMKTMIATMILATVSLSGAGEYRDDPVAQMFHDNAERTRRENDRMGAKLDADLRAEHAAFVANMAKYAAEADARRQLEATEAQTKAIEAQTRAIKALAK